jgi:hypothetical protein
MLISIVFFDFNFSPESGLGADFPGEVVQSDQNSSVLFSELCFLKALQSDYKSNMPDFCSLMGIAYINLRYICP